MPRPAARADVTMAEQPGAVEREVEIVNEQGLHARPVMRLADLLSGFAAQVEISKGDRKADPRSVFDMMLLEAPKGTRLKIVATGDDAPAAVEAIAKLIADKFYED